MTAVPVIEPHAGLVTTAGAHGRYGLVQVIRGEIVKIVSLRSTLWTVLVTTVGMLGVTILSSRNAVGHRPGSYRGFDPTNRALTGLAIGTLAIGVIGILAATGEYATGTIRSSLAATPRRLSLLAAKAVVVTVLALLVGEVLTFACFAIGQAVLSSGGAPSASLAHVLVFRAVALSGAFLALLALLGLGLGLIIRHTAGAMSAYVGCTFLVPVILSSLPGNATRFTPVGLLANSVSAVITQPGNVSALEAISLMGGYAAAVLAIGAVLVLRRDA